MAKKRQETGYVVNISEFRGLIEFCKALGIEYTPTNALIIILAMETLLEDSRNSLNFVSEKTADYQEKVNNNEDNFNPFDKFATRILNTAIGCNLSETDITNIKALVDKIHGERITKEPEEGTPEYDNMISSSHTSMGNKLRFISELADFLELTTNYVPDVAELTVAGIRAYRMQCVGTLKLVTTALQVLKAARRDRNILFDKDPTGLVYVAIQAKAYVKGKYGATSQTFNDISKFHFRKHDKID